MDTPKTRAPSPLNERVERLVDVATKITQDANGSPQEAVFSLMAAAVTIAFENDDDPSHSHDKRLHALLDVVLDQMGTAYAEVHGIGTHREYDND